MTPGRLVFPALRWRAETGFSHEDRALDEALELGVGGFIVFGVPGARADEIGRLTEEIRHRAGRPVLIGADLERGAGQQARRLTEWPPPGALASLEDETWIRRAARSTANDARRVGIDWVFAPVADLDIEPANPIVQTRSFGADPARVGPAVAAWVSACQEAGALACAKHYPGHGRTTMDSHAALPAIPVPLEVLERTDLAPFHAAVRAGVAAVMTGHLACPQWDPSGLPATLSPVMLGHLRSRLGFEGLVVTDALVMEGVRRGPDGAAFAARAVAAGCDLLLYPPDPTGAVRQLGAAVEAGTLPSARLEDAERRYDAALAWARSRRARPAAPDGPGASEAATRLLERGMVRGRAPRFDTGFSIAVVDDDQAGWYAPGPSDLVLRGLARRGLFERHGAPRVVLAFAEPKAAKGRAGFGPESLARLQELAPGAALVILFAHPRLVEQIPGEAPVLLAWHRQRLMQEAAAKWLAQRVG
jgi:beta-glucosidase-like glycosyl hydrolase